MKRIFVISIFICILFVGCGKSVLNRKNDIRGRWDITWYFDDSVGEIWKNVIIQDNAVIIDSEKINVEKITKNEVLFSEKSDMADWEYDIKDNELHITCQAEHLDRETNENVIVTLKGIGFRVD